MIELLSRLKWKQRQGTGAIIISPTRELALQTFGVVSQLAEAHNLTHGEHGRSDHGRREPQDGGDEAGEGAVDRGGDARTAAGPPAEHEGLHVREPAVPGDRRGGPHPADRLRGGHEEHREAAAEAIRANEIIECLVEDDIRVAFEYPFLNDVMRIVKEDNVTIISQYFNLDCDMTLRVRRSAVDYLRSRLAKVESLRFLEE